ncbi:hypothetical protein GH714_006967 [Hevea brasiliensis]|uniref:BED-type domain-containing protein n=1 Tax=Hevea brasiliensis TaxID=3981 RepID=A0A6A6N9P2_HEVBR|nr:hypothetical protein GH714_006967 [Hevea brasiliensis]
MAQQETTNDLLVEPSHPPPVASSQTEVDEATSKMKRKGMKPRSAVWDHFSKFVDGSGIQKGKCNYCYKEFFCDPKKNGTTALRNHMFACIKNPHGMTTRQSQLYLQPSSSIQEGGGSHCGTLNTWNFNQERSRRNLAKMIIVDELPFMFVEGEGFKEFMEVTQPRYATIDPCFKFDLQSSDGLPDSLDWENVRRLVDFLGHFYDLTLRISGSRYVTSNIFFNEISSVDCLLQEWQGSNDIELAFMGDRMKVKFDKYWGDPDKMNKIIYIAVVVDPRYKLEFMEFALSAVYGKEKGMELAKKIKLTVYELFDEYKKTYQAEHERRSNVTGNTSENNESEGAKKKSRLNLGDQFLKHK